MISAPTETGMSRLSLGDADKEARDWFCKTVKSLSCKVTIDAIGNIFAVRPGRFQGPPTVAGLHLDTQPTGGRYDGILRIMAAIEMLRVLEENKVETEYPIGVVTGQSQSNLEALCFYRLLVSAVFMLKARPIETSS
jgi:acetylornithine deacetylase/succinyl-diaminopimelate desuccinylase-like protein